MYGRSPLFLYGNIYITWMYYMYNALRSIDKQYYIVDVDNIYSFKD